ncbi:MAG TPA: Hsp20/alpha crystallin family protein [Caulobacter sp.]|nr:Hsp20/alpha crystallin family protein [Caulobacter sp.]
MSLGELVPWGRKDRNLALQDRDRGWSGTSEVSPFLRLHQEMNRLFDDVFRGFDAPAMWNSQWPTMEVEETDSGYRITAELPGMDEKDIDISFRDGVLTLRGEKRSESQDKGRRVSERYYGRFERRITLGDVDDAQARASFDKGVLTIDMPRSAQAEERVRRIPINGGTRH